MYLRTARDGALTFRHETVDGSALSSDPTSPVRFPLFCCDLSNFYFGGDTL